MSDESSESSTVALQQEAQELAQTLDGVSDALSENPEIVGTSSDLAETAGKLALVAAAARERSSRALHIAQSRGQASGSTAWSSRSRPLLLILIATLAAAIAAVVYRRRQAAQPSVEDASAPAEATSTVSVVDASDETTQTLGAAADGFPAGNAG